MATSFLDLCEPGMVLFGPAVSKEEIETIMSDLKAKYKAEGGKDLEITIEPYGEATKASWVPIRE
jgi:hypothetical protein